MGRALVAPRVRLTAAVLASLALLVAAGCNESALQPSSSSTEGGEPAFGLTAEQSSRVLAEVDGKPITLGELGRALERMDQFDRLRYQSKERRRELLSEMIDVELLAAEARRRGLDKEPEVKLAIQQTLRDAVLAQAKKGLPAPAEIPEAEIRAYFEANAEKFNEPERRRVSAIVLKSRGDAEKVLEQGKKVADAAAWGELFQKHSLTAPKERSANAPVDLAGDLGIVGPPGDARGANPQIPEVVRAAVFKLASVGDVAGEVLEHEGKFFVVRMSGLTAGHRRTLAEADRSIRVVLLQQKVQEREQALTEELKKKIKVEIDEAALAKVNVNLPGVPGGSAPGGAPGGDPGAAPGTESSAPSAPAASGAPTAPTAPSPSAPSGGAAQPDGKR